MKKKILLATLGLMISAILIGVARAQINVTITLTDAGNNSIPSTVPIGTTVYVHGFYQDISDGASAKALMEVYYDNGSGLTSKTTLYSGSIDSGQTITRSTTLTQPGSYEFRWTCTQIVIADSLGNTGFGTQCVVKRGFITVTLVTLPVPEPGTFAGLIMALSAFGLLAVKKAKR
ncbi:MAG: PEP-CTERM sorting domain-containing protein [Candidatus Bathyarchaeia archaeon]|jgi:hypothetical protein